MARKITWLEPTEDTVTKVEISKSSTIYGTYTVVDTIDATSDGNPKSSSNTWVTSYTDTGGTSTDWYKIRFYDSATGIYSDYSDPITSEELLRLCTVDEVKEIIDTVGRWTDDEIFKAITQVDDLIYIESGTPITAVWSEVGKIDDDVQYRYYVGEENIYRVDRVFYGTTTVTELFLEDEYKVNTKYGMIEIYTAASGGVDLDTDCTVEIHYVPKIYNQLSKYRTAQLLLEKTDLTNSGDTSKELQVINEKVAMIEQLIIDRIGVQLSSEAKYYDPIYGVNRKYLIQDHYRNNYIGNYGWD